MGKRRDIILKRLLNVGNQSTKQHESFRLGDVIVQDDVGEACQISGSRIGASLGVF